MGRAGEIAAEIAAEMADPLCAHGSIIGAHKKGCSSRCVRSRLEHKRGAKEHMCECGYRWDTLESEPKVKGLPDDPPKFSAAALEQRDFGDSFVRFTKGMLTVVTSKAQKKGYAQSNNGRAQYDAICTLRQGRDDQSMTEIISKTVRWEALHNPEDLEKIAAWAFLAWDRHMRSVDKSEQ